MTQLVAQPNGLAVPARARAVAGLGASWSMCGIAVTYGTSAEFGTPTHPTRWPSEPPR
jgi:hypothetical protein